MTTFTPHSNTYTGLPYIALVSIYKDVHTAVVDFVLDGTIHYYHLDALGVDACSAFLVAVEQYHNTGMSKQVPLSVFLSANNYAHVCTHGYRMMTLDAVSKVEGLCPQQWFPKVKTKWRRKDMLTGQITSSKHRRSEEEKEADRFAAEAVKAARKAKRDEKKAQLAAEKAARTEADIAKLEKIKAEIKAIEDQAKRERKLKALAERQRIKQVLKDQAAARRAQARKAKLTNK